MGTTTQHRKEALDREPPLPLTFMAAFHSAQQTDKSHQEQARGFFKEREIRSIFRARDLIIDEYGKYVRSFLSISDERIRAFIERELIEGGTLWPDALLQLSPSIASADSVEELSKQGALHPAVADIFRNPDGKSIRHFRHQQEAISRALALRHLSHSSGPTTGGKLTLGTNRSRMP